MNLGKRGLLLIYVLTAFLSASLLFLSEPMMGKLLLPLFGGSPSVWNTCMVFFQAVLLAGYAYAHWSVKSFGLKRQPWLHGLLLLAPLGVLPIALPIWATNGASYDTPILSILAILLLTVGGPFFILATSGPLLQRWFSVTSHPQAQQPYFLYAASNLGSFVALLAYPFVVEPTLSLAEQLKIWAVGYGAFVALTLICILVMRRYWQPQATSQVTLAKTVSTSWIQRSRWLFFAFIPSSLMLGVTSHITSDVASVPLLWVIPLALYLLTFVLAFGVKRPLELIRKASPMAAATLFASLILLTLPMPLPQPFVIVIYLAVFTLLAVVAHGRLAVMRPEPARLTEFYLWVAIGGVLGGVFNSLIAPLIFNGIFEFPLVLLLSVPVLTGFKKLLQDAPQKAQYSLIPPVLFVCLLLIVLLNRNLITSEVAIVMLASSLIAMYAMFSRRPISYGVGMIPLLTLAVLVLATHSEGSFVERTFYGVIKVTNERGERVLYHGVTRHGSQSSAPEKAQEPTTYYHRKGPLGDTVSLCRELSSCQRIGVMGLGTGTVAAYGRTGDNITFYEIDPAVAKIASDPGFFTFLSKSQAKIETVIGDGRLSLANDNRKYDLLVIDAFSSDAIPMHLLSREAVKLYKSKLTDHGIIAFHISNRYLNLQPALKAAAKDQQLQARWRQDAGGGGAGSRLPSEWVIMTSRTEDISRVTQPTKWKELVARDVRAWSDDYSNIFDALF